MLPLLFGNFETFLSDLLLQALYFLSFFLLEEGFLLVRYPSSS
jgi:hypothetical protein